MAIAIGVYGLEKALGMKYTVIPFAFDVLMIGALIPIYDSNIFTVHENENIINEQLGNIGFLTFDKNRVYKGCNSYMENVFPELSQYRLGQVINNSSQSLKSLIEKIDNIEETYKKILSKNIFILRLNRFY